MNPTPRDRETCAEATTIEAEFASSSKVSDGNVEMTELNNGPDCDRVCGNSLSDNVGRVPLSVDEKLPDSVSDNMSTDVHNSDYKYSPTTLVTQEDVDKCNDLCTRLLSILTDVPALSKIIKMRYITDTDTIYRINDKYILDEIVCLLPSWLARRFVHIWDLLKSNHRFQSMLYPDSVEHVSTSDPELISREVRVAQADKSVLIKRIEKVNGEWAVVGTCIERIKTCSCGNEVHEENISCVICGSEEVICSDNCFMEHMNKFHP